jgi:NAD(P)-dependent dehydrogenase (short-subunit alcohol dehydrogenase family)
MKSENSSVSKTIIVTGASGAIGKAIARQIAAKGHEVIMVCRDGKKAEEAKNEILENTKNSSVSVEIADLSRLSEIKALAQRIQKPVFALVNNAAATPKQRLETPEGIEIQFATNVLGYFWMSLALHEHLIKSPGSRIVNVASYWAGDLELKDLQFKRRHYDNNVAYRQSKQANRMLTVAFAEKFQVDEILVNSCHPGEVNSKLSNSMGFSGSHSPDKGAETPVWLATGEISKTGKWFEYLLEQPCRFSTDTEAIDKLYNICMGFYK